MVSIDNVEGFRKWLIKKLQPICDADPEALAKYVLALVKKDKNENDLKVLCREQLEVFLKNNTENFVEDLFESLKLKSYMELNEPSELGQDKDFRKDKNVKMRSRSRSPIRREIRHRSPNDIKRRIGDDHRSRRRSPDNRRYYSRRRSISPRNRRVRPSTSPPYRRKYRNNSPNRRSRSRSPHNRKRSKSRDDRRDSPNKRSTEVKKMGRCYDYDEKGYCIKGESCPYDHGTDAIAVEEETLAEAATNITNDHHHQHDDHKSPGGGGKEERGKQTISIHPVLNIPPPLMPRHPPPPHLGLPPPHMMRFPPPSFNIPPPRLIHPALPPPYNPELPSLGKEEHNSPILPTVTVATMGNIRKRIVNDAMPHFGNRMGGAPPPKRPFNNNYNRRVLLITKIPLSLNNITKLNEHFAPFGAINNIQVKFDSRPDQAIVEFAHHNSAKAALTDPGAVLNNRFIRLCWFDPDKSAAAYKPNNSDSKPSVKDRLGTIPKKQDFKYTAPGLEKKSEEVSGDITRTIDNPTAAAAGKNNAGAGDGATAAPVKTGEEKEKLEAQRKLRAQMLVKAKAETQLKEREMQLKKFELHKQYQQLLHKNLDQQKLLMKKLESNDLSAADKKDITKTITTLHNNVIKLRESCKSFSLQNSTPFSLNREQDDKQLKHNKARRELLDVELDLYNSSTSGEHALLLKKRMNKLMQETGAGGAVAPSSGGYHHHHHHRRGGGFHHHHNRRGGGAGGGRGGGRSYLYSSEVSLDRRPNQLLITGFLAEEKDDLQAHFEEFGAFDSISFDENLTKCTLKYKSRNVAQQAAVAGRSFKQKKLNIIFDTLQPKVVSVANNAGDATSNNKTNSNGQNASATTTAANNTTSSAAPVTKQKTVELEDFQLATLAVIDEAINKKDAEEEEESEDDDDVQVELNVDTISSQQQQQLFDDEYREFDLLGDDENLLDEDELLQGNEE